MSDDVILETRGLAKRFGAFTAVRDVSLRVRRGAIHALIGPNGAGKTTCFNLLTKFLKPSAGAIVYEGEDITALAPAEVARRGMVRSFQISAVFPHMSARDNVRVALLRRRGRAFDAWRSPAILSRYDEEAMARLADVGLADDAHRLAAELPYGRKRALEIATTLALDPKLLLLDEPMAGMAREDVAAMTALIARVAKDRTVLMVEHNLGVVAELCDVITVLTRGAVLAEGDYAAIARNRDVRRAYLGAADG